VTATARMSSSPGQVRLNLREDEARALYAGLEEAIAADLIGAGHVVAARAVLARLATKVPGWLDRAPVSGEAGAAGRSTTSPLGCGACGRVGETLPSSGPGCWSAISVSCRLTERPMRSSDDRLNSDSAGKAVRDAATPRTAAARGYRAARSQ
jgi:hypothetical protein